MTAIAPDGSIYPVKKSRDGAFVVDNETVTKLYYGRDAVNYLKKTTIHKRDTQVVMQRDNAGSVLVDGKEINLTSRNAILIKAGKEAKVDIKKGYPLVITSERAPAWYEKYSNKTKNAQHRKIFDELTEINAHTYLAQIKEDTLGLELADKLVEKGIAEKTGDGYVEIIRKYEPKYLQKILKQTGFRSVEISQINALYKPALDVCLWAKESRMVDDPSVFPLDVKEALVDADILSDFTQTRINKLFWKKLFPNEYEFRRKMGVAGISKVVQDKVVKAWEQTNKLGYDYSGAKLSV